MRRRRAPARAAAALLAAALAAACGGAGEPELPPGTWLAGDAAALRRVLDGLGALRGTPAARASAVLRGRLEGCSRFVAHARRGGWGALGDAAGCAEEGDLPPELRRLRGDAALVFAGPASGGARVAGTARLGPAGSVALRARIRGLRTGGVAGLLLPAERPPGPAVLSGRSAIVHARVRAANGLDVASLVSSGSQADSLFSLKSDLFAGAVLDGTWELALYMPGEARRMPDAALAVGVRVERAARAAAERFVGDLRERWPVSRVPFELGPHRGACIPDLKLLPELAPCYVVTDGALVVGWNPVSLRRALEARGRRAEDGASRIAVRLARLDEADRRLRAVIAPDSPPPRIGYAWDRLRILGERGAGGAVRLRAELRRGEAGS